MIDCPRCGSKVDGLVCPKCKYAEGEPNKNKSGLLERRVEVEHYGRKISLLLCQNEDRGQLCSKIAVFSPSTTGSGPWYCRDHDPHTRGALARKSPPAGGFAALRDVLRSRQPGEEG